MFGSDQKVTAVLTARDQGFADGMKKAAMGTQTLMDKVGGIGKKFSAMGNSSKVMANLGVGAKAAKVSVSELDKKLRGVPTALDTAALGVQRLASANGDIKKSTKYFLAMNDAVAAGGAPAKIQAAALDYLTQAYSRGKMEVAEWESIMKAMPRQLNQVAKAMGMSMDELSKGLRDGTVSMDDFTAALVRLDKNGTNSARQSIGRFIGMGAAMQVGMKAVDVGMRAISSHAGDAIKRFDTMNNFPKVMANLGVGAKASKASIKELSKGIEGLPTSLDTATLGVQRLVSKSGNIRKSTKHFLAMNDAIVAGGAPMEMQQTAIEQLTQAYSRGKMDLMEWKSLMTAMPAQMTQVGKAMGMTADELGQGLRDGTVSMDDFMDTLVKLDKKGIDGMASMHQQALDASGGIQTAMTNLHIAVTKGMANAMFAIDEALKKNKLPTIGQMINSVGDKIGNFGEKVAKVIGKIDLAGIVKAATPYWNLFKSALKKAGDVIKKVGGFLLDHADTITKVLPWLIAAGLAFKAYGVISTFIPALKTMGKVFGKLAGAGWPAVGALAGLVAVLVGTAIAAAVFAPALLAGGIALAVFGAGLAVVGVAAMVFAAALAISKDAIVAIIGALADAFNSVVGTIVSAVQSLAPVVISVMTAIENIITSVGDSIRTVLDGISGIFDSIGRAALNAGKGFYLIAAGIRGLVRLPIADLGATLGVVARGLKKIAGAGPGLASAGKGMLSIGRAIRQIATGGAVASAAIGRLRSSAARMGVGMKAAAAGVKSSMNQITAAAKAMMSKTKAILSKTGWARSCGAQISRGFARGIRSHLGEARAAANALAATAEKAVRAKAKIHSPSRVFADLGKYIGVGFAVGIESMSRSVDHAVRSLVSIPEAYTPQFAVDTGSFSMDDGYIYGGDNKFDITVISELDGREVARATAPYTQEELKKRQSRENRNRGRK